MNREGQAKKKQVEVMRMVQTVKVQGKEQRQKQNKI